MKTYTVYFLADTDSSSTSIFVEADKVRYFDESIFFYDTEGMLVAVFKMGNIIGWQVGEHLPTSWEVAA